MIHIEENSGNYNQYNENYNKNDSTIEEKYIKLNKDNKNIVVQELLNIIKLIQEIEGWITFIALVSIFILSLVLIAENKIIGLIVGIICIVIEKATLSFIYRLLKIKYIVKAENIILLESIKNQK